MKNKIVGWINIFWGLLIVFDYYLITKSSGMDVITYFGFTDEQQILNVISIILFLLVFLAMIIINILYIFKNKHDKKSMMLNILTTITAITPIILTFGLVLKKCFYLISFIILFNIILVIINKKKEGSKSNSLIVVGIIGIILYITSAIISIIIINDFEVKFANNEKNLVKNISQLSRGTIGDKPIMAKKNNKWGYIDKNGNVLIDYMYDDCMEFTEMELSNNTKYYFTPAIIGNELRIITDENETVASFKNNKSTEKISCIEIWPQIDDNIKMYSRLLNLSVKTYLNEFPKNPDVNIKEERYKYLLIDDYGNLSSWSVDDEDQLWNKFNIKIEDKTINYNGKKIDIKGTLYIDNNVLQIFSNGYIPFYNFEENVFGWIDLKGEVHSFDGKLQILDFIDNYILIKNYSDIKNKSIFFINYQGEIVSDFYKEISILPNGFIVKKENGKNVYIDKNFKERTEEYDIMDGCRADDEILIVANLPQKIKFTNEYAPNNISFSIINLNTFNIVSNDFNYINGMKNSKYEVKKYEKITDSQYIKIICNVDSIFTNDDLYTKYYGK